MWREVKLTAEAKPVVVSMGGLAASGGYWIATAADTIAADPLTLTGSIGVFYTLFDVGGLFENKIGVTFDVLRTGPHADVLYGLRPLSETEQLLLQRSADETYQTFLDRVARSRRLDVARVDSIAQGRVWTGADAREVGLVDVLGDLDTAIVIAAKQAGLGDGPYRTRLLPRPKTFVQQLGDAMSARVEAAWLRLRTTEAERAFLEQARTLRRLLSDHGTVQARLPVTITVE
jgi:protease-4